MLLLVSHPPKSPALVLDLLAGASLGVAEVALPVLAGVGATAAGGVEVAKHRRARAASVAALPEIRFANRSGRLVEHQGMFSGKAEWGAMIAFYNDGNSVTSLKFTGPQQVVQNNRKQFLALAESIRIGAGSPQASAPAIQPGQQMPADHVPINQGGDASAGKAPSPFTAEVPDGWAAKEGRRVLHHTFGQGSEVYVSQLGGTVEAHVCIRKAVLQALVAANFHRRAWCAHRAHEEQIDGGDVRATEVVNVARRHARERGTSPVARAAGPKPVQRLAIALACRLAFTSC